MMSKIFQFDDGLDENGWAHDHSFQSLPDPALVIDVRERSSEDAQPLWYLAREIADLEQEMRLHAVTNWRLLTDCIHFLKVDSLPQQPYPVHRARNVPALKDSKDTLASQARRLLAASFFEVETPDGHIQHHLDKEGLLRYIVGEQLNSLRNGRITANNDSVDKQGDINDLTPSPEQATVRVLFLIDLQEEESLLRAALYAQWLKDWCQQESGAKRPGREEIVETDVICMNAIPHQHYDIFAAVESGRSFDTAILIQTYRDDYGYIDELAQIHQAEIILYTLLLHWPECMKQGVEDSYGTFISRQHEKKLMTNSGTQEENQQALPELEVEEELRALPWSTYIIGIAALENSTRWGARWLDYGLAAKIIETLRGSQNVTQRSKNIDIETRVNRRFQEWLRGVQHALATLPTSLLPGWEAIGQLQQLMAIPDLHRSTLEYQAQSLQDFRQKVAQFYTGAGRATLQMAIDSAPLLMNQLQQAILYEEEAYHSPLYAAYAQLTDLQNKAQLFLLEMFEDAQDALPRALDQLSLLSSRIDTLQQIERHPPDLDERLRAFETQADRAQRRFEQHLRSRRWPRMGTKSSLKMREKMHEELYKTIQAHLNEVYETISTKVALALLHTAGLYDPHGKPCLYQQRLTQLDDNLKAAYERAKREREMADQRRIFNKGESKTHSFQPVDKPTLPRLHTRQEMMKWDIIEAAFIRSYKELINKHALDPLAVTLLRRLGTEQHTGDEQRKNGRTYRAVPTSGEYDPERAEQEHLQGISAILVAALLSAHIEGVGLLDILPLLDTYEQIRQRFPQPPTILDSDVLNMRDVIQEALLNQIMHGNNGNNPLKMRALPAEVVLAEWVSSQHDADPELASALDSRNMITYLEDHQKSAVDLINELGRRNKLIGFPDKKDGEDHFYLLAPADKAMNAFYDALDDSQSVEPGLLRFSDIEKLIHLHIHRIRQL